MSISDEKIYTSLWSEVRTLLVAKAPFITNSTTTSTTAAVIAAQYNDKEVKRPQVCILPVDKDESNWKFGSDQGKKMLNIIVECWAFNSLGIDQLGEQVEDALKVNEIPGVSLIAVTSSNALNTQPDSKYYLKTITFTYDRE